MTELWFTSDPPKFQLGAQGLDDLKQCVAVLLGTIEGTVVLDRRLGLDPTIIDEPMTRMNSIYRDIYDKFAQYEPRIDIKDIRMEPDPLTGKVKIRLKAKVHEKFRG